MEFCPLWSGYHFYLIGGHQKSTALTALFEYVQANRRRNL
ncbi:hypothetical protein ACSSVY_001513 [Roseovarius sp. MBR-51]